MINKFTQKLINFAQRKYSKKLQLLQKLAYGLCLLLGCWLIITTIALVSASAKPVDAFFVLGGSIRREIHVAQLAKQNPQIPILISQGSQDPCIWLIFQREAGEWENVWLEKCAKSTFGNFYYSIPILRRWGVHKVKMITSPSHLPRAKWMAQILLGSHGMWVDTETVKEKGRPANRESWLKTTRDVTLSFFWAVLSQFIQPQCSNVIKLTDVDMQVWLNQGFKCERQGGLGKWEKSGKYKEIQKF